MSETVISFVSTRGRSFNIDLRLVKEYLSRHLPEVKFEYYLNKTSTQYPMINKKMEDGRRTFCANAKNIVCMDSSIPIKIPSAKEGEHRLFLSAPFDYQFKVFLEYAAHPEQKKKKTYIRCTHIVPGSPFCSKLLRNCYQWEDGVTFLDQICLPVCWDMMQPEKQNIARKNIEFYYPFIKEKKILSILFSGKVEAGEEEEEPQNPFGDFSLKEVLDLIKDDWFIVTNNYYLIETACQLSSDYKNCFGYTKNKFSVNDLLYISDMLITNNSKYATMIAARKKPFYYAEYTEKHFGAFIKKYFPELYLGEIHNITTINFSAEELSEQQKIFCREFAYDTEQNPMEKILEIFQ
ncbi:MAG: hypothetical protein PUH29_10450 [Lachnospiraceae bacterium]|nr:hypothetical protein [Lachnospiraceae bacterium]MDY5497209.1 hypothetical protein [Anaerobutyricum sp.]